jgi:hypothetical protein
MKAKIKPRIDNEVRRFKDKCRILIEDRLRII